MSFMNTLMSGAQSLAYATKNASPQILFGVGMTAAVAATVYACVQTTKLEEIVDEHKEKMEELHEAEDSGEITAEELKKETTKVYFHTAGRVVKLYSGPALVLVIALGSLGKSFNILSTRNAGLMEAVATNSLAFNEYRQRVRETVGAEKEQLIFDNGKVEEVEVVEMTPDGKSHKSKVKQTTYGKPAAPYSVLFDEANTYFNDRSHAANKTFIICQQNALNNLLKYRGWVSLWEALDKLGFEIDQKDPHLSEMLNMGWTTRFDKFRTIDFGLNEKRMEDFMDDDPFAKPVGAWLTMNIDPYPIWGHAPKDIIDAAA